MVIRGELGGGIVGQANYEEQGFPLYLEDGIRMLRYYSLNMESHAHLVSKHESNNFIPI